MPTDPSSLIVLGVGAVILAWLIFSVIKKLFSVALVAALAFGGYMLWTNPDLLRRAMEMVGFA
ncbi:hypothetical protein NIM87_08795 [Devosia sp. XJ19-1]|uniref:Uncharacterized protein n=1 Tax=Devosia ureilytica TaxID=2952754 RepID=A0A9Q4ANI1_9HYPH|nr:hypothetical protein [Devosia ureilytica]MCP8883594.1 hypothetical protein [Devosia ureilytica]MCP8887202.1 hypothetical protein [Devosia ureilytica]